MADRSGWPVEVEVIAFRPVGPSGEALGYRVTRAPLEAGDRPDVAALLAAGCSSPSVSHSTSWRQDGGVLVLTYAVVPDPAPDRPCQLLGSPGIVWSGDPTRPSPEVLHPHHVAAHVARHLVYLSITDPGVRRAASDPAQQVLWGLLTAAAQAPVATHDQLPHLGEPGRERAAPPAVGAG